MSIFDFKPSISEVGFYRKYYKEETLEPLSRINAGNRVFELVMKMTLTGLDLLINPVNSDKATPFYLNILTYTQRGMRDIVSNGLISERFDSDRLQKGTESLEIFLKTFYNSSENDEFDYDFISNIFFVKIFISEHEIKTTEELETEMHDLYNYNTLFLTKIPYINTKTDGDL